MSNFKKTLSQYWERIQGSLFPWLEEEPDSLTKKQMNLIAILEIIRIKKFVPESSCTGRPAKFRTAIARAFVSKIVYNMNTTRALIKRLQIDKNLRRICGFENKRHIPSETTFSKAFDEFANLELPQQVHEALIKESYKEDIILLCFK